MKFVCCCSSVAKSCPNICDPMDVACQASLSCSISQSLLKHMFIKSVMPSNHLILCHPLLLLPSIFPSIKVFSNESTLSIKWPEYWSFSFNISPSNEYSRLFQLGLTGWVSLQSRDSQESFPVPQLENILTLRSLPSAPVRKHLDSQESFPVPLLENIWLSGVFPVPQLENISSLALTLLYSPTFTSVHDYWKNHPLAIYGLPWWLRW